VRRLRGFSGQRSATAISTKLHGRFPHCLLPFIYPACQHHSAETSSVRRATLQATIFSPSLPLPSLPCLCFGSFFWTFGASPCLAATFLAGFPCLHHTTHTPATHCWQPSCTCTCHSMGAAFVLPHPSLHLFSSQGSFFGQGQEEGGHGCVPTPTHHPAHSHITHMVSMQLMTPFMPVPACLPLGCYPHSFGRTSQSDTGSTILVLQLCHFFFFLPLFLPLDYPLRYTIPHTAHRRCAFRAYHTNAHTFYWHHLLAIVMPVLLHWLPLAPLDAACYAVGAKAPHSHLFLQRQPAFALHQTLRRRWLDLLLDVRGPCYWFRANALHILWPHWSKPFHGWALQRPLPIATLRQLPNSGTVGCYQHCVPTSRFFRATATTRIRTSGAPRFTRLPCLHTTAHALPTHHHPTAYTRLHRTHHTCAARTFTTQAYSVERGWHTPRYTHHLYTALPPARLWCHGLLFHTRLRANTA